MNISNFFFHILVGAISRILFVHISEGALLINGTKFYTFKTLSFGFYQRTITNSSPVNDYQLRSLFTSYQNWNGSWYFGVNYRVRCQQVGFVCRKNVDYSDLIAHDFIDKGWILIPHYKNGARDQGVDFFKMIPEDILAGYLPPSDNKGRPIFNGQKLPANIQAWINSTIVEAKGLI